MNEDVIIPIAGIGMPVLIVWIIFYYDSRVKEQFHATLQKLIESGQELSPELLESVPGYKAGKKDKDDIFILSSGHAAIALYCVIEKYYGKDAEKLFKKHGGHPHLGPR